MRVTNCPGARPHYLFERKVVFREDSRPRSPPLRPSPALILNVWRVCRGGFAEGLAGSMELPRREARAASPEPLPRERRCHACCVHMTPGLPFPQDFSMTRLSLEFNVLSKW